MGHSDPKISVILYTLLHSLYSGDLEIGPPLTESGPILESTC